MRGHGEGSIYFHKGSGLWAASVTMSDGRRVTSYCCRFAKPNSREAKRAARDLLKELLRQRDAGLERPNPRLTVAALLSGWLAEVVQVRPSTRKHYRIIAERHLVPALGTIPLSELTPLVVQRYLNA